jgi:hypothetical protein
MLKLKHFMVKVDWYIVKMNRLFKINKFKNLMDKVQNYQKKSFFLIALALAISLVSLKWILSYLYFDEDIVLRVINESYDSAYYPIIKSFSDLNFSPSYSNTLTDLSIISFPVISLFINSLFYKIIGIYSFIFLEIICTTFFIFIFYNIFIKLNFSTLFSIICSLLLFVIPTILIDLAFINIKTLDLLVVNLQKFYSMRFPRPIISNLFLFSFIYFLIDFFIKKENYNKSFYILSTLMGVTINVFFYLFFIEFFILVIVFLLKFKKNFIQIISNNFKHFFISLMIFLLFILIFQLQLFYSEPDYIQRLGVFYLNASQKIILFEYLENFFFGKKFIFLFLLNTLFYLIIKNKLIKIFYLLFLSSILSPIFFFYIFNKGVDYYHFFDWIVITGFLFPVISSLHFIDSKFLKNNGLKNLLKFFLILIIIYFNISNGVKFKNNAEKFNYKRNDINEVTNFINKNRIFNNKNLEILSFNIPLTTWFILKDFNNFSLVPLTFWTPKKNETLDKELISSIKFLDLDKNDFYEIIKNEKKSWRFKNEFVYVFFGRKYLANSLVNFNSNLSDFTEIEKKYILSNSLIITHQVIIPKLEIQRLLNKFDEINTKINPDVVILDKNGYQKITDFKNNNYCQVFSNKTFKIYINKNKISKCEFVKN